MKLSQILTAIIASHIDAVSHCIDHNHRRRHLAVNPTQQNGLVLSSHYTVFIWLEHLNNRIREMRAMSSAQGFLETSMGDRTLTYIATTLLNGMAVSQFNFVMFSKNATFSGIPAVYAFVRVVTDYLGNNVGACWRGFFFMRISTIIRLSL